MSYRPQRALVLLIGITLTLSACAMGPELDVTIHESDRGAVYVERIPDRSFRAAHPITLSVDTMARLLRGVAVKEDRGLLGNIVIGRPEAVRAFRDEDIQFLAPLLVEGLARVALDQQVGFRIVQPGMSESRKGSLYAYGRSLYLTVPWLIPLSRNDAGGPALPPTILFTPESAKRPDAYRDARSTEMTLVIDYGLLASLPNESGTPPPDQAPTGASSISTGQTSAPAPAVHTIPSSTQPSEREWNDMKKELQDFKRQLAEQEAERNEQKHNGPSKQKTPVIP
ncbi:MAG TPA: hypothetical protein VJ760_00665 [Nitrospiraceae bacterium]|nr:hypothetical protein [Nitrospiraceae bacterium]